MCLEDLAYALYAVGGTGMVVIAYKLFGKSKKAKSKTNTNPSADHNDHSISTE